MALEALGFLPLLLGACVHSWGWSTALGCLHAQLGGGKTFPLLALDPVVGSWAVVTPSLGLCEAAEPGVLTLTHSLFSSLFFSSFPFWLVLDPYPSVAFGGQRAQLQNLKPYMVATSRTSTLTTLWCIDDLGVFKLIFLGIAAQGL